MERKKKSRNPKKTVGFMLDSFFKSQERIFIIITMTTMYIMFFLSP